jgi:ribosomal protein S18 acetylase RimI-like enzyme
MSNIRFRQACENDGAHLALFADMATRRLSSYIWNLSTQAGQSAFEVGRSIICGDASHSTHFRNWRIAELNGAVIGALNVYVLPPPVATAPPVPDVLSGPAELKAIAEQSFYISSLAMYREHRGNGLGVAMLDEAVSMAQTSGTRQLSLMLGSFNTKAHRLYRRHGFEERARRPFVAFTGSDTQGEWILMQKELL